MIEMVVRDQDEIDLREILPSETGFLKSGRSDPGNGAGPLGPHGVREEPNARHFDQNRGVSDPSHQRFVDRSREKSFSCTRRDLSCAWSGSECGEKAAPKERPTAATRAVRERADGIDESTVFGPWSRLQPLLICRTLGLCECGRREAHDQCETEKPTRSSRDVLRWVQSASQRPSPSTLGPYRPL